MVEVLTKYLKDVFDRDPRQRARIAAYALGGVFAALGGLVLTASTSNGNATSGVSYTLNSVAAIVVLPVPPFPETATFTVFS